MTRRGGREALEKNWVKKGEAADDGATSRSIKAFQFDNIGNA